MALCGHLNGSGSRIILESPQPLDLSVCEYVGLTASEYQTLDFMQFNQEVFELAFGYAILMWVTGLAFGLIIGKIRQTRIPT